MTVDVGPESTRSFDDFVRETSGTLQFMVDATVQNSTLAMGLIDLVEKVRSHAAAIQGALEDVQGIAKETDLLALNAAIEDTRGTSRDAPSPRRGPGAQPFDAHRRVQPSDTRTRHALAKRFDRGRAGHQRDRLA